MAVFVESDVLSEDLANKVLDLNTDTFKWYLTDTLPDIAADAAIADLPAELANGNGYTSGGLTAVITFSRTGPTTTVSQTGSAILTATGPVGPFRYLCLVDVTASRFIGYVDHGSSVTMAINDTYLIPAGARFTIN
jgi:hypothetical protein